MKTLLFILSLLIISCQPSKVEIEDDPTWDVEEAEEEDPSPITWSECGYEAGDHPCDFTLKNHLGADVNLYNLYGKPIVVDFSTMWCYYCQIAATEIKEVAIVYETDELVYITILIENFQGETPTELDLIEWVDHFGIDNQSTPVLSSDRALVDPTGQTGWKVEAWPTFYFIDKEMVIAAQMRGWSSAMVQANIEQIVQ